MLQQFYSNKKDILKKSQNSFLNSNSIAIKIGIELEFFLLQKNRNPIDDQGLVKDFIFLLRKEILENFSLIYEIEKEQGVSQIEIKTIYTHDLEALAEEVESAKNFIKNFATAKNFIASFEAQPFIDDCGNALQFNISFHDSNNKASEEYLNYAIAGLLKNTNQMMVFLAPNSEDYLRFSDEINYNLFKKGKYSAPTNLSFGNDNRSCAIRVILPNSKKRENKCLEYRVACANADPFLSMAMILTAINDGIINQLNLEALGFKQIFGNAFDEQYQVKKICKTFEEAQFYCDNFSTKSVGNKT